MHTRITLASIHHVPDNIARLMRVGISAAGEDVLAGGKDKIKRVVFAIGVHAVSVIDNGR